jgi:hypothetical protein
MAAETAEYYLVVQFKNTVGQKLCGICLLWPLLHDLGLSIMTFLVGLLSTGKCVNIFLQHHLLLDASTVR